LAIHADMPTEKSAKKTANGATPSFIAESPAMKEVLATIQQVADSRATVLITGESGVGKEVVAKALHQFSSRTKKPFVAVSCAALPETLLESELFGYEKGAFTGAQGSKAGRFELAHEGTLFLDEIGEVPLSVQVKLLRVLQEREFERLGASKPTRVDVRLITATNRHLMEAVESGVFRLDLLYRLQVVEVEIPALRDRKEDIEPLCNHFLAKYCKENDRSPLSLGADALEALHRYSWPGNVRELENTMERAVVLSSADLAEVGVKALPSMIVRAA
jgi:two-component system, NtrC family, response regulator AtoC